MLPQLPTDAIELVVRHSTDSPRLGSIVSSLADVLTRPAEDRSAMDLRFLLSDLCEGLVAVSQVDDPADAAQALVWIDDMTRLAREQRHVSRLRHSGAL